ncbi:TPA: hypothetical protein ACPV0E_003096 [Vibrio parahaemolyticus]
MFKQDSIKLKKVQPLNKGTLFRNLGDLFAQLYILLREAILCIDHLNEGITEDLAEFIDTLHLEGIKAFELEERLK